MMKNEQIISLKQSGQLTITSRLQQAISLLQMSTVELNQYIEQFLVENPLLERQELDEMFKEEDFNNADDTSSPWQEKGTNENFDPFHTLQNPQNLYDHLRTQINIRLKSPKEVAIALCFLELIDDNGFLVEEWQVLFPFDQINFKTTWRDVLSVLKVLQTFDPIGIFAQNVRGCLEAQMLFNHEMGLTNFTPQQTTQYLHAFDLLKKHSFEDICTKQNLDKIAFQQFLLELKHLKFNPTADFVIKEPLRSIIPDIRMLQKGDDVEIILNPHAVPKILLNSAYYNDLRSSVKRASDIAYLKDKFSSANWLIHSLEKRTVTLLQVSSEIVNWQKNFLLHGAEMKPMTLAHIATHIGLHESTISRITTEKYIETPRGIFALKSFFVNTVGHVGTVSSTQIQNAIRLCIAEEQKESPLSDEDLVLLLESKGLTIARRTIAKYRVIMGIGSSSERKRLYKIQNLSKKTPLLNSKLMIV